MHAGFSSRRSVPLLCVSQELTDALLRRLVIAGLCPIDLVLQWKALTGQLLRLRQPTIIDGEHITADDTDLPVSRWYAPPHGMAAESIAPETSPADPCPVLYRRLPFGWAGWHGVLRLHQGRLRPPVAYPTSIHLHGISGRGTGCLTGAALASATSPRTAIYSLFLAPLPP